MISQVLNLICKEKFKQLNKEQRHQIRILLEAGKSKSEIAYLIGIHK